MGTEKFMAFKADGTAYRLKGRILRHLDNEPVTDADKSNIRDTLGITGTNGDLLAANNLDDVASKDTAKLNLEIGNIGTGPQDIPLNSFLNSGAYLDFDAFYQTGTWTPTVSFGGGSTGVTYSIQEGYYTKTGNIVTVAGTITLSSKGSDNGTFNIKGLPYTAKNTSGSYQSGTVGYASSMSSLTGALTMLFLDNDTAIQLQTWTSTGVSILTEVNFNATSNLRFSGTYQIA